MRADADCVLLTCSVFPLIFACFQLQFYLSGVVTKEDSYCNDDRMKVNHAVVIEGLGTDKASGQRYWIVRNSWGTGWGEQGRLRLKFGANTCSSQSTRSKARIAAKAIKRCVMRFNEAARALLPLTRRSLASALPPCVPQSPPGLRTSLSKVKAVATLGISCAKPGQDNPIHL